MRMLKKLTAGLLSAALLGTMTVIPTFAEEETTFTVALDSDIVKLDPAFAYDFTTNPVVNQITQGLLCFDEDNQLVPLLASSWEQVDDLTYVYQIRDDVTFSDGTAMTMDDVIYSLDRIRDPETASYLGWMYDNVDTIEATGDWELTVKLLAPDATWQYVLGTTAGHVIKKEWAESVGEELGTPEGGLVGTGPYVYESWQNGSEISLSKNENYWGEDAGYYDNLVFKIITEDTTRVTALQTGDVDCTVAPPESLLAVMQADPNLTLTSTNGFGVCFLAMNCERAPFDNAAVRNAVSKAIDLDTIYTALIRTAGSAPTVLPNSDALFTLETERWNDYVADLPAQTMDVDGAKALLAEAGYADGFECTLIINDSSSLRNSIALAIQDELSQIGITVNIEKVSTDEHTAYQFGDVLDADGYRDYDMIIAGWEADYPDPSGNLLPLYQGGNSSNSAAYNNEEVTALINKQMQESDAAARVDLMLQAYDLIIPDAPYVFLYYPVKNLAVNSAFTGVSMNASWIWNIHFQNVRPAE